MESLDSGAITTMKYTEIKSVELAFKAKGIDINSLEANYAWITDEKERAYHILLYKLHVAVQMINEGWIADWTNTKQPKYYIWWNIIDNPANKSFSGRGLSLNDVLYVTSYANVAPCLCFESEEKSRFAARILKSVYEELYFIYGSYVGVINLRQKVEDLLADGLTESEYRKILETLGKE